jgi:hypothetical protein
MWEELEMGGVRNWRDGLRAIKTDDELGLQSLH